MGSEPEMAQETREEMLPEGTELPVAEGEAEAVAAPGEGAADIAPPDGIEGTEVAVVAARMLRDVESMIRGGRVTPSNVRNITGALRDIRELCGENQANSLVILMEGDDTWAK